MGNQAQVSSDVMHCSWQGRLAHTTGMHSKQQPTNTLLIKVPSKQVSIQSRQQYLTTLKHTHAVLRTSHPSPTHSSSQGFPAQPPAA